MYLDTNSSANFSASTIRDCRAMDGGSLHLNGDVTLNLVDVTMGRNAAFGSRGGALNAAGALGRNTIEAHGGTFVNNSAREFGGMACLWPASAMVMDGLAEVVGSMSSGSGGGILCSGGLFCDAAHCSRSKRMGRCAWGRTLLVRAKQPRSN
jgi:hypothetical protein